MEGSAGIEVRFFDTLEDRLLGFAVIICQSGGKWVLCKHRQRDTYEVPGGHREPGETILETAKRELHEETGAIEYEIAPVCVYSVKGKTRINQSAEDISYGMLYAAEVKAFEPELHSEIESILITEELPSRWTYPLIQPALIAEAQRRGFVP